MREIRSSGLTRGTRFNPGPYSTVQVLPFPSLSVLPFLPSFAASDCPTSLS